MKSEEQIEEVKKNIIIAGVSSDIGLALAKDWINKNWNVFGTYRTSSKTLDQINGVLKGLVSCDFACNESVDKACNLLNENKLSWDVLVMAPGLQEPIGLFEESNFDDWTTSINVNFINQLRFLHNLLPERSKSSTSGPTVVFFAGGGVNSAPKYYSAYTVAKIALIKIVELLAAEIVDVKFIIVGPGWVKTKIHFSVLDAKNRGGESYDKTKQRFELDQFIPMDKVVECCNVLIEGPREVLTGRNYSVEADDWYNSSLIEELKNSSDAFKLRRSLYGVRKEKNE